MPADDLYIRHIPSRDQRLGWHVVQDPRSRGFTGPTPVDRSTWRTRTIRIYDPVPNPNQVHGNCTMCAKAVQMNAIGNRKSGVVLNMAWAEETYVWETNNDEFPGGMPQDDTGSSSVSSCKTAQHYGVGGEYRWRFDGADGVVQEVMAGNVVNIGSRWDNNMFDQDEEGFITPGGGVAGGHEWSVRGYIEPKDALIGRCWWGRFRDFYIKREHLNDLLHDDGDAHVQARA